MSDYEDLLNLIRREVERAQKGAHPRAGIIDSYDPKAHAVKVKMQPEGILSGWIPIATQNVGGGHGLMVGPEIGAQVVVGFLEGDVEAPFLMGRIFSDQERPPQVASGDVLIKHKDGHVITIANGAITATHQDGTTMSLKDGAITAAAPDGTLAKVMNGKVYLGEEGGSKVITEAGPSSVVYAKV